MKTIGVLLLSLFVCNLVAADVTEKEIKTEVNEVTVFLKGAQIIRKETVELLKGETVIKFVNLSPFIDAKSLQVKASGELTVLSVNHQQNYLDKPNNSDELMDLEGKLATIEEKIKIENTYLSIIKEELAFLQENRDIGGKNQEVSVTNLQQAANFYSTKLTSLKLKEIERNKTLKNWNKQKTDLLNQINTLSSKKEYPTGEVLVKVDAKNMGGYSIKLSYFVNNAGWFPAYDIRAKNINEPIQLIYKANVKQDTKVDWKNVKLTFSSANPNVSGVAPELKPYFLDYYSSPPTYKTTAINGVSGKVMDEYGEPVPGATVLVSGTTISTITDLDGNYSITIPPDANQLEFNMIGFEEKILPITGNTINAVFDAPEQLKEVVVVGYAAKKNPLSALKGKVAGLSVKSSQSEPKTKVSSLPIPTNQVENQTTVDFEIKTPYSILSDNKNYVVDMQYYDLPAFYQYYCVPKLDKDAFLIANIIDWEQYNLLAGEANIFFEGTYIGKTLLDVRYAADTLGISLGRDKQVSVNREKLKNFTDKQFIGNKKEETIAYTTTVKNNKRQAINMILLGQVPVPTIDAIEVTTLNISGGTKDAETGEIRWEFQLSPSNKQEFELRYSVKYPKNRNLIVE